MSDLLETVIEAHGGLERWNQLDAVSARLSQSGAEWTLKGHEGVLADVYARASLHEERESHHPFGAADRRSSFTPARVAIETTTGEVIEALERPRASFAGHTAVAMELARVRTDQITLAKAEDHDRIAGDLHDHVIQELFALGMRMQGHAARSDPATAELVNGYVDTLDEVINKIRTSIFGLHQPDAAPAGLSARVMEIIDEHTAQLGFTAGIRFAGPLDPGPDEALAHDILAVTREALSNCARHARATAATISLVLQDGLITLDITDNGRGLGTPARSSGLSSMRRRAERNGGTFQLTTPPTGGTHLTWTARPH